MMILLYNDYCVSPAGPFATCLSSMGGSAAPLQECSQGLCSTLPDTDLLCELLVSLAQECAVWGEPVGHWRDSVEQCRELDRLLLSLNYMQSLSNPLNENCIYLEAKK